MNVIGNSIATIGGALSDLLTGNSSAYISEERSKVSKGEFVQDALFPSDSQVINFKHDSISVQKSKVTQFYSLIKEVGTLEKGYYEHEQYLTGTINIAIRWAAEMELAFRSNYSTKLSVEMINQAGKDIHADLLTGSNALALVFLRDVWRHAEQLSDILEQDAEKIDPKLRALLSYESFSAAISGPRKRAA